jgi:hypothetical protein
LRDTSGSIRRGALVAVVKTYQLVETAIIRRDELHALVAIAAINDLPL